MRKIKLILGVSILLFGSSVSAALIQQTFDFSITNDLISDRVHGPGNSGQGFELQSTTNPFFLNAGDVVSTQINFDRRLQIRDTRPNDYWFGNEPLSFIYWFSGGSSAEARISYDVTFDVFSGNLAQSPVTGNSFTAGGGTSMATTVRSNITDHVVTITGLNIRTRINSYSLVRGDGEYGLFTANFRAESLRVLPVPEPPAILLFGIGLIGLIGFTKRRKAA
jgi:hypothetical protein